MAGALRLGQVALGACLPTRHHSSLKLLSFTHSSSSLYRESSAEITHPVFLLLADRSHCRPKTKSHLVWRLHRHHLGYSMRNACRNIYSSRSLNCIPFVKCLKLHSLLGFLRWVMISAGGQLLFLPEIWPGCRLAWTQGLWIPNFCIIPVQFLSLK